MKAKKFTRETIRDLGTYERPFLNIEVGSTVAVSQRIKEGDKERIQIFEGDVIGISNNGPSSTFTVRKIGANSVAVERIFPFYSPRIENIRFVKKGKIRRAKLYYMRDRIGKAARVEEKVLTKEQKARAQAAHAPVVETPTPSEN
jgi:large subunit ribosomal protein L19